jgi:hypothetical protein
MLGLMAVGLVYLGLFPQGVFNVLAPALEVLAKAPGAAWAGW